MNRHIKKCPTVGCPALLNIRIKPGHYGKVLRMRCPLCRKICKETIPHPKKQPGWAEGLRRNAEVFFSDLLLSLRRLFN